MITDTTTDGHTITHEQYMVMWGAIDLLTRACHDAARARGWWDKERNVGEALCLIHSEISEAMEGYRRNRADEHIADMPSITIELVDALVRIFDLAGGLRLELGKGFAEKMCFNMKRVDHSRAARSMPGGKSF